MQLGFTDERTLQLGSTTDAGAGLANARTAGASVWRFQLSWREVAPTQPPNLATARDPGWEGYRWTRTDEHVRRLASAGLQPLPFVFGAPAWAEGSGRPEASRTVPVGVWKPNAAAYGAFATAVARRYSGTYPDPTRPGTTLPAIKTWQAWNEPNLSVDISPQWVRKNGRWTPESPRIYRALLNAFYAGVKSVNPKATVVTAGTGPYGDLNEGDPRMMPVRFWRELLCVSTTGKVPKAKKCPKVSFDAIAHHPYPIGPPRRTARNADDAVVPDVKKITRLLPAATRRGTIRPAGAKPLWITEISWDSRPDPDGVSLEQQATYLQGALYVLYQQGADVVTWFNLRDQAPTPSYAATYQSGVFLRGSTPAEDVAKPSYTAFRFPFTAYRTRGVARLWGMAPAGGGVTIQARQGDRWVTAARLRAAGNRIFTGRLRVGQGVSLRAVWNNDTSLVWRTF
ncbi:hypothetical protein LRS13_19795 [Svornostia abyssi]|uniref:Uncharacterized protein n=1 Tax=Svornostia abyssi TaxID=2898438 RepID=A0ABY5PEH4_9ACTN|nr:hypothetical protein LRS13_19795 [Parviterribacteraceae bacterium J379]